MMKGRVWKGQHVLTEVSIDRSSVVSREGLSAYWAFHVCTWVAGQGRKAKETHTA